MTKIIDAHKLQWQFYTHICVSVFYFGYFIETY